jgi:hypothetical protein
MNSTLNLMNLIQLSHFSHCWLFFFTCMELWDPMHFSHCWFFSSLVWNYGIPCSHLFCVWNFKLVSIGEVQSKTILYNKESNVALLWRIWQARVEMNLNPFSQVPKFCISLMLPIYIYIVVVVLLCLLLVIIIIILFCLLSLVSCFNFNYCFICKGMTFQLMEPSCSLKNVVHMPHAPMIVFPFYFLCLGFMMKIEITYKKYIHQITLMPVLKFVTCICGFL